MRVQKYIKTIFLLLTLFVGFDSYAQEDQFMNTELGGASMDANDGLKMVIGTNGNVHVFRRNQTQYYWSNSNSGSSTTCGIWNDATPSKGYIASKGVQLGFYFEKNGSYNSSQATWKVCSTTAAKQVGNTWTTSISGYVTSTISGKKFYVTMDYYYIHPNNYFLVDYYVRAPSDIAASDAETVHVYLYHDSYILGQDGSRPYGTINSTGQFVGDYRSATVESCASGKQDPRFPSTHGFKTAGSFRSFRSGAYGSGTLSAKINAADIKFNNSGIEADLTCRDDEVGVEFVIGPLSAGQVGTRQIMHGYGNQKGEFDNTVVKDPVVNQGANVPVKIDFTSATFSENEGDVTHQANITIRVSEGKLSSDQIGNFTISGGTAVDGTDYAFLAKGFVIPAGDYTTAKTFTLNNVNILGNTNCDGRNRTFNMSVDSEDCNDLVQRGSVYQMQFTILDDDVPTVNQSANVAYCKGVSVPANTFTFTGSTLPNTTYAWTNSNTAIGLAASGTGNIPLFTTTNTGTAPIVATIKVTPKQGTCEGDPKIFTITVNPTATISTVLNNLTYCGGSSSSAITLTSATAGTTYAWTNSNTAIGLAAIGTGNIPTFTATNTTANPITATIRVTPTANGCVGTYKEYTITVNPTPTVSTVLNNQTYCNAVSSPAITLASATTSTTYAWTNSNTAIGLAASGTGSIPTFTATNTTANPITATIRVTPTANGCTGTYKEYTITVRPVVVIGAITGNPYACEGDIPQTIKGIATIGGTGTFTYQWQQSINNTTWTNISGATGLDYTPGVLTQNTYFKRISIDANCGSFESNSFLITKVAAGVKFTWKSTAIDNNWNNPDNWINTGGLVDAVPTKCSDVHIPSVSNRYPALDENTMRGRFGDPVTDKITFHFGGQVAYPHKLTYNKAFVQYNWGYYAGGSNEQPGSNLEGTASKMITRDRWYMLAAPLKKMASGDFALGGYPITWQSLYNAPHPSTGALVEGDFSTAFSSNDIDLSTKNNALAVKVACYNSNIGYSDQRHLESLQGILEIPYFENSTVANYHPGHVYNKIRKESRFYYFDEKTLQQLASPIGTLARGDEAYRFVFEDENTNKAPNIVVNGVTVPGYTHRVTSGASNDKTVMIGNPFMATINSRLFFEANRTKLKEDAGYYMLTPTNQVWSRYEYKTENKVPALQAIVITLADGLTSADLVYPLEGTYALTEVSNQTRSVASLSDDSGSSLYIRATDGSDKTSDYAILNAEETGESSGISKMIYPASHSVTEAFIVSSDQEYNLIDFYNGKRTEVGLGIKSSNQKDVLTLEFENVESFKHATGFSPVLIDRYLNVEQDLSSNNVYRFNQRKTESERQYSDVNRFSLRLSSATSGIIDETNSDDLIRVTYLTSQLEVTCSLGLVQVDVYDLQGRYLHTSGNLTEAPVTYTKYLPLSRGVYIVKVKTSQGQIVAKKINAL